MGVLFFIWNLLSELFAVIIARPGVHRSDQLEVCRKIEGSLGSADCDDLVIYRLMHDFRHAHTEFRKFVEEKHGVVRETVGVGSEE